MAKPKLIGKKSTFVFRVLSSTVRVWEPTTPMSGFLPRNPHRVSLQLG